jgi:hypothetical protein
MLTVCILLLDTFHFIFKIQIKEDKIILTMAYEDYEISTLTLNHLRMRRICVT